MWYIWITIGVIIGSIITNIIYLCRSTTGILRVDHSNPEKDIWRFEFNKFTDLSKKKRAYFKIDNNADLSQK